MAKPKDIARMRKTEYILSPEQILLKVKGSADAILVLQGLFYS